MKRLALAAWLLGACARPCPDSPAYCVSVDAGACFAWVAGCCDGLQACKLGTSIVTDAGSCAPVSTPAGQEIQCD